MFEYADKIDLWSAFQPDSGTPDIAKTAGLICLDKASKQFVDQYPPPKNNAEQRRWIKAALTVRPPRHMSKALLDNVDHILQAELASKTITDANMIPGISGSFPNANKISIWNGDITTLKVDAIVNAANSQLLGCFQPFHACIDNAIHTMAGPQLREDCAAILEIQGKEEPTGHAKITRGYNLPSRYVIHTVGPIISDHKPSQVQAGQLASCYEASLNVAADAGVKSIALCGISTGVFGYPMKAAATIAVQTVTDWISANPDALSHVIFNTYGAEATNCYRDLIQ